ncbi:MAG: hypothetical protein IIB33_07100, partial [Chloroflexi bacterium]|nr:hypothetical protein [Chloroflexota bacterium]
MAAMMGAAGAKTVTLSSSGVWTATSGGYTFSGDDVLGTTADRHMHTSISFAGDFEWDFIYNDDNSGIIGFGVFASSEVGTFDFTTNLSNNGGGMASMTNSWWVQVNGNA